jgi:hypothetical protein
MDINDEAEMCAEYRQQLAGCMPERWSIQYVGLVDRLPGGASKHGIKPGCLCVKAAARSKLFGEGLSVCIGIGEPDGRKMDPSVVAGLLEGALKHAEQQRSREVGGRWQPFHMSIPPFRRR